MSDLQALHTQARKLILTIRAGLERVELAGEGSRLPEGLVAELQRQLQQLQKYSQDMDAMWRMQTMREPAAKRDVWKAKVEQVSEETDSLRTGLQRFTQRQQRRQADEAHRQELLERRLGGGPLLGLDADIAARRHLDSSRQVAEEAYQTGVGILGGMASQRERLKNTHRKLLDVLNRVGLSDSLLRLIERRQRLDKVIVYGGMLGVVLLVSLLYWWLKWDT